MRKCLLAILLLAGAAIQAQAQTVFRQSFENTTADNWAVTAAPAAYHFFADEDIWKDTTYLGNTSGGNVPVAAAAHGTKFWGIWDIENNHSKAILPAPYLHYLDFAPVTLNATTAYTLKFKYFTHIVGGSGDSVTYAVEYNNGTTWTSYTTLASANKMWDSVSVNIPANTTTVRLRIRARINGGDDYAAIDGVEIVAGATTQPATVRLQQTFMTVDEAADTARIPVVITNKNTQPTVVNLGLVSGFATADTADFKLLTSSLTFSSSTPDTLYALVKINNDAVQEVAEYFALDITGATNANITAAGKKASIYIKDNDYVAPAPKKNISMKHLGSFAVPMTGSSAEIVAFDSASNKLFAVNSLKNYIHVISFNNPSALAQVDTINMSSYGGGINSVAVRNGILAVAVEASPKTDSGKIVFLDTAGNFLKEVKAGVLPDMITFTPDGKYVMTPNEGEPSDNYAFDPEGSVTIVDMQNGVMNATSQTISFQQFNGQEAALRARGVRIYGTNANAARDFEPEYIAVSKNSDTAWITMQENNAVAVMDIATKTILNIYPLNTVDHSAAGNALDASDNNGQVLIANWPVRGMYLPDAIASYQVNGKNYFVTANEGDAREWGSFVEEARIGSNGYKLDATRFPNADLLKATHNLGRLNAVTSLGDTDGDGDFDEIYVLGGRGFSIWDGGTGAQVYNSGHSFEQITYADPKFGHLFNADHGGNAAKNRSDNKGPEPEGVTTGIINDTTYAFIAMERIGGVMVYNVSNPAAPVFVQYINTRDSAAYGGDQGGEGIIFIDAKKNRHNKHYIVTANEVSATLAVFEIDAAQLPDHVQDVAALKALNVYPNPAQHGVVFFSQPITGGMYDMAGRQVRAIANASNVNVSGLTQGIYLIKADGFAPQRVVVSE